MHKDNLLNNLHKDYRADQWINEIYDSAGTELDKVEIDIEDLKKQYWFDTMTWAIPLYEKKLGIKPNNNNSGNRRALVEAKWKSNGKCTLDLIKAICSSWKNARIDIGFINGKIKMDFTRVPNDLDNLFLAIEGAKPAHLNLDVTLATVINSNLYIGAFSRYGEEITVYPYIAKKLESKGKVNIALANNAVLESITIYPKEG